MWRSRSLSFPLALGPSILLLFAVGTASAAVERQAVGLPEPVQLSATFSRIAKRVEPAVVSITAEVQRQPVSNRRRGGGVEPPDPFGFGEQNPQNQAPRGSAEGSGFIVDRSGYIITNHHVIEGATKIKVRLDDKTEYAARLIGSDSGNDGTDLAVLKIDAGKELPFLKLGDSDSAGPGDWVLAIGNPFGFNQTLTAGIISAKGRVNVGSQFQSFIQTDAAINPGNSGGPLVNMAGDVIGVNTMIASQTGSFEGLGFALPSNTVTTIYRQLLSAGKVTRGWIGISYDPEPDAALFRALGLKDTHGVIIDNVTSGGPAERAGLLAGDIITEVDHIGVSAGSELVEIVSRSPIGRSIPVKLFRDKSERVLNVQIDDRAKALGESNKDEPPSETQGGPPKTLGIRVQSLTPQSAKQLGLDRSDGVVIASVDANGLAADAGLARGMVIKRVYADGQDFEINDSDDFHNAEARLKSGMSVALMLLMKSRAGDEYRTTFVSVTMP
jgi:serine protease Do